HVHKRQGYIVDKDELTKLFEAMFKMFETDLIMVNDLDNHLTGLKIPKNSISYITNSHILNATVSANLSRNDQLTILEKDATQTELINDSAIYNIESNELTKLLDLMFIIIGEDSIVVNQISNQFDELSIAKNEVDRLLESSIISATISHKLVEVNELSISNSLVTEEISILGTPEYLIYKTELHNLLLAMFVLLNTERIELLNLNTDLSTIVLTASMMNTVLESQVLQLTLSEKFVGIEDLVIPSIVTTTVETIKNEIKYQIDKQEFKAFFDAIFATSGSINASAFELNHITLPTTKATSDLMTNSIIVSATLSNKIMSDTSSVCVIDEKKTSYIYQEKTSSEQYIEQEELSNLLLAFTVGMGLDDPNNLGIDDIAVPKTDSAKQAIVESEIIRATISEKVLNQDSVSIELKSTNLSIRHLNKESVGVLSATEILNIIRGIELLNPDDGSFDNLILDVGQIIAMENKEEVLEAIAQSDVYRYIISCTLGRNDAYKFFLTDTETVMINGELYTYQASILPKRYNINYPTIMVEVYTSFKLDRDNAYVCRKNDILALQYTNQNSF
ncbi:MAG: hypothetical protein K2J85_04515, partial [Anaeroplasmataceae bacterium]|nr:hypothetical protein [Anaeroplasmataceae bacterium]